MDKNKALKIGGAVAIVLGSIALFAAGVAESAVVGVVGAVFALAAVIVVLLK